MGARMRDARKALGESQEVFGRRLGVRKLTVINYEKGLQSPTAKQLFNLYLSGVDAAYIFFGTSTPASRADQAGPHARGIGATVDKVNHG